MPSWHTQGHRSYWRWSRRRSSKPATRRRPCSQTTTSSPRECAQWHQTNCSAQCSVAESGASMRVGENGARVRWPLMGSIRTGEYGHKRLMYWGSIKWNGVGCILIELVSNALRQPLHQPFIRWEKSLSCGAIYVFHRLVLSVHRCSC